METASDDSAVAYVAITDAEKTIFRYILNYCSTLTIEVTPRVAGGWVRDKIMGKETYDIDIALDKISGHSFVVGMCEFYGRELSSVGLVKSNPDKSKHLETAVMRIGDRFVDFVCLRTERYTQTRIPEIMLGTPTEDAFRRDITINALFYNLRTEEIEDYTKMGLRDIQGRVIRTPIEPLQTFLDDPLRILRAFRFAARYNFTICDEIYASLQNEVLGASLRTKVSNERIGVEIMKIAGFECGDRTLVEMVKHGLCEHIFKPPEKVLIDHAQAARFADILRKAKKDLGCAVDSLVVLNLYTVLIFMSGRTVRRKRDEFWNVMIVKESLKWTAKLEKTIFEIERNLRYVLGRDTFVDANVDDRKLVRIARDLGRECARSLLLGISWALFDGDDARADLLKSVHKSIHARGYASVYDVAPLVNGNDIKKSFRVEDTQIKRVLEQGVVYQVLHPDAKKDEIITHLAQTYEQSTPD